MEKGKLQNFREKNTHDLKLTKASTENKKTPNDFLVRSFY